MDQLGYDREDCADVSWLGFAWTEVTHASDYFEQIYGYAVDLIKAGKAFVCSLDAEAMRLTMSKT